MDKKNDAATSKPLIRTGTTRRRFLAGTAMAGAGLAVSGPLIIVPGKAKAAERIVFVSYGGTTQEIQERVFIKPFMKETGIEVISASGPDAAKIKAMVQTKNVEWDLVNLTGAMATGLEDDGLLEPLDKSRFDAADMLFPDWLRQASLGWYYYTGGIAYDPKRHPAGKHPRDWKQLWDVKAFPGRRGLRTRPEENLEMALMADGVAAKDVYPINIDRAFKALDRIKPHVPVWIKETPKTVTMIQTNEVDFTFTYSGRVTQAQDQGVSIDFVYETPLSSPSLMGIPKGTKNRDAAMKLLAYFMRPDRQLEYVDAIDGYSPASKKAYAMMADVKKKKLPDPANPSALMADIDWWGKNFIDTNKRFQEWLLT